MKVCTVKKWPETVLKQSFMSNFHFKTEFTQCIVLTRVNHRGQYLLVCKHSMNDAYLTSKYGTLTDRFILLISTTIWGKKDHNLRMNVGEFCFFKKYGFISDQLGPRVHDHLHFLANFFSPLKARSAIDGLARAEIQG